MLYSFQGDLTTAKCAYHIENPIGHSVNYIHTSSTSYSNFVIGLQESLLPVTLGWWNYNWKLEIMRMFSILPITANREKYEFII